MFLYAFSNLSRQDQTCALEWYYLQEIDSVEMKAIKSGMAIVEHNGTNEKISSINRKRVGI